MYDKTITLFNRRGSTWIPTIIHNVDLNADLAAIVQRFGATSNSRSVLHIRYRKNGDSITVEDKVWLPPIAWRKQSGAECTLTFTEGNEDFDFFYAGEYGDGTIISDDDFGIDGFYDYMVRNYDGVYAISSVSTPYVLIPHFEIVGR